MNLTVASFEALGTTIRLEAESACSNQALALVKNEAERLEQAFSRFRPGSNLSQLNQQLGQWVEVDEEFLVLLKQAQTLHQQTAGWFDVSVHRALTHWGYDANYNLKTKAEPLNMKPFSLEYNKTAVKINSPIDFGALGKGYFLDCCEKQLTAAGITHYLLNAGGDLRCQTKTGAPPWTLYFEDPRVPERVIGHTELMAGVLASSSASRRQWGSFHHLVDPHCLLPAQNMQAVYVQHPHQGLVADALSTSFFVMGFAQAQQQFKHLAAIYPGLGLMLVSAEGEVWRSAHFSGTLYTA